MAETRNLINYLGDVVGTITLPDGTTESQWANILAAYAQQPASTRTIIMEKLKDYKRKAIDLLDGMKADNTLAGINVVQSAAMFEEYQPILTAMREGAFPTAIYMLQQKTPSGFVTQEMLDNWIALLRANL